MHGSTPRFYRRQRSFYKLYPNTHRFSRTGRSLLRSVPDRSRENPVCLCPEIACDPSGRGLIDNLPQGDPTIRQNFFIYSIYILGKYVYYLSIEFEHLPKKGAQCNGSNQQFFRFPHVLQPNVVLPGISIWPGAFVCFLLHRCMTFQQEMRYVPFARELTKVPVFLCSDSGL